MIMKPILSWEELCDLPYGANLCENTKIRKIEYTKGLVTRNKDMMEIFYVNRDKHFQLTDRHFKEVLDSGDNTLYHVYEDHFSDDVFEIS